MDRDNQRQVDAIEPRGRGLVDFVRRATDGDVEIPRTWTSFAARFDTLCSRAETVLTTGTGEHGLRAWLGLTPPNHDWRAEPLPDGPLPGDPCHFSTVGELVTIGVAAVSISRDTDDRRDLLGRVGALFDEAGWLESAGAAADHDDPARVRAEVESLVSTWDEGGFGIFPPGDPIDGPIGDPDGPGIPEGPFGGRRPPFDDCALRRRLCMGDILELLEDLGDFSTTARPTSSMGFSDNITSVTQRACAGDTITVTGTGFGATQPSHIRLVMRKDLGCDTIEVDAANWSDTQITFAAPDWARGGCIGFMDDNAIAEWNSYYDGVERRVNDLNSVALDCGTFGSVPLTTPPLRIIPTCPPCTDVNRFDGTIPEIVGFRVNNREEWRAQPTDAITLDWIVDNADEIRIRRVGGYGPAFDQTFTAVDRERLASSANITLNLNADGDATFELTATNTCDTVTAQVTLHVRRNTTPTIVGIEVVQVVQTFVIGDPGRSNTVPVIEGKRTLARIYVESGLPAGYNGGRLGNMAGRARVRRLSAGGTTGAWVAADTGYAGAPPAGGITRASGTDTLNVELPFDEIAGRFEVQAEVSNTDAWAWWSPVTDDVEIEAYPSPTLDIVPLDVIDNFRANAGPTAVERRLGLSDTRSMLPLAEANLRQFSADSPTMTTNRDYDVRNNWRNNSLAQDSLMDDLEEIAEEFRDRGEIWCATVPQAALSAASTIVGTARTGTIFRYRKASWVTVARGPTASPVLTAQRVAPHEVSHVLGLDHVAGNTGEVGVDVAARTFFPATTANYMNAAAGPWIGIGDYVYLLAFMRPDVRARLIREGWAIALLLDIQGVSL